jgi:tetratricopeptide (TPR) repeat protein
MPTTPSPPFQLSYSFRCLLSAMLVLSFISICSAAQKGAAYFDFGVFAFEDRDYESAEQNFQKATKANPKNADFQHYLGKTYLKTERFKEAEKALNLAWKYQSSIEGLRYDMALVQYRLGIYPIATFLFAEELAENPSNVLAQYYIGICMYKRKQFKNALENFVKAAHKNSSIKPNGYFYAGICHMQLKNTDNAIEKFSWVAEHAPTDDLKTNAEKWLLSAQAIQRANNPLHLNLKISTLYDDNIALEPLDQDIYADEGDFGFTAYLSGKYRLLKHKNLSTGIGYNHYQSMHIDLSEYNLMGSIPNLYLKYYHKPWTLGLTLQPTYYWLDNEKYLLRNQVKTDIIWNISEKLSNRYALIFYDEKNYITRGRDGQNIQFLVDAFYRIPEKQVSLLGGIGFDQNNTDHSDYKYFGLQAKIGLTWFLPRDIIFAPTTKIYNKWYNHTDSTYNKKRDDFKFELATSFSKTIVYQWLTGSLEYKYTKNDSNISVYSYASNKISFSISASY